MTKYSRRDIHTLMQQSQSGNMVGPVEKLIRITFHMANSIEMLAADYYKAALRVFESVPPFPAFVQATMTTRSRGKVGGGFFAGRHSGQLSSKHSLPNTVRRHYRCISLLFIPTHPSFLCTQIPAAKVCPSATQPPTPLVSPNLPPSLCIKKPCCPALAKY